MDQERDLTAGGIRELEVVGSVWLKRGHEARVAVKDAGHGPMIDVREYVTSDAYPTTDTLPAKAAAKGYHRKTKADGYVGPTRKGLWLSLEQALEMANQIYAACEAAERIVQSEGREVA